MLILEIALGIVLAVLILRYLSTLIAGTLVLASIAVLLAVVAALWAFRDKVLIVLFVVVATGSMTVFPVWLKDMAIKCWPGLGALVRGEPPYAGWAAQPRRITVMLGLALLIGGVVVGSFVGVLYVVDQVGRLFGMSS